MDGAELARWTRFAGKGGIGKCTATADCVAENAEDLMFLKDDEITVLMQLPNPPDTYLGYCEGVVGRFQGAHVWFHAKLKRPIMAKRASSSASLRTSSSMMMSPSPMPDEDPTSTLPESMPERLKIAVRSPSPERMSMFTNMPESLRRAIGPSSPVSPTSPSAIDHLDHLDHPTPRHHSTDDTLQDYPHARHHSTDDTVVVTLSEDRNHTDTKFPLTRSPSPAEKPLPTRSLIVNNPDDAESRTASPMQTIRDQLRYNEDDGESIMQADQDSIFQPSHDSVVLEPGHDSVVFQPGRDSSATLESRYTYQNDRNSMATIDSDRYGRDSMATIDSHRYEQSAHSALHEGGDDAGINIGLSLLGGGSDESDYSDSEDENATRTAPPPHPESINLPAPTSIRDSVMSEESRYSDSADSPTLEGFPASQNPFTFDNVQPSSGGTHETAGSVGSAQSFTRAPQTSSNNTHRMSDSIQTDHSFGAHSVNTFGRPRQHQHHDPLTITNAFASSPPMSPASAGFSDGQSHYSSRSLASFGEQQQHSDLDEREKDESEEAESQGEPEKTGSPDSSHFPAPPSLSPTSARFSESRKSTDTYDPWGDIYDDYRYSISTMGSGKAFDEKRSTMHSLASLAKEEKERDEREREEAEREWGRRKESVGEQDKEEQTFKRNGAPPALPPPSGAPMSLAAPLPSPTSLMSNSPLLHTRFGSSESLPLSPHTPHTPGHMPDPPATPPLQIRKRIQPVGQGERQSLFMPHPGAPKPPPAPSPNALAIRQSTFDMQMMHPAFAPGSDEAPPPPVPAPAPVATGGNLFAVLHEARGTGRPTIYARTHGDLTDANGPVGITFSVEAPPPPPLLPMTGFAPKTSSPLRAASSQSHLRGPSAMGNPPIGAGGSGPVSRQGTPSTMNASGSSSRQGTPTMMGNDSPAPPSPKFSSPPRQRPRSRSFGEFNAEGAMDAAKRFDSPVPPSPGFTRAFNGHGSFGSSTGSFSSTDGGSSNGGFQERLAKRSLDMPNSKQGPGTGLRVNPPMQVAEEQRVSRVHVPDPIKVPGKGRFESWVGSVETTGSSPSPGHSPAQSQSQSHSRTTSSTPSSAKNSISLPSPGQLALRPRSNSALRSPPPPGSPRLIPPSPGPAGSGFPPSSPGIPPPSPGASRFGEMPPPSPRRADSLGQFVLPSGSSPLKASRSMGNLQNHGRGMSSDRGESPLPSPSMAYAAGSASRSLSLLTRVPESRMSATMPEEEEEQVEKAAGPAPAAGRRTLSPPPPQQQPSSRGGSPSLSSMARVMSPPPPSEHHNRDSRNTDSPVLPPSPSPQLDRDSPVLGHLPRLSMPAGNEPQHTRAPPSPLGPRKGLTLSPPPSMSQLVVESPSPSPASLSAFPLPPSSYSPGGYPFPPTSHSPTQPDRKLSLPNLRARTLSHRAGSMSSQNLRPSIDSESVKSVGAVSVSVKSMEFEMLTGRADMDSPVSSLPSRPSTSVPATPTMTSPPTAMPILPPPAKDARDREGKFLMALSEGKKKKKLKKLVLDGGVPMSLRWLVWMEFVSSTALPNHPDGPSAGGPIGGGLGGGGPGGRNTEALKALLDAVDGEGPGRLKAAYRRMCPDVGWGEELDHVLPFLLGLAPEQDAFWIFCCVMDTHLRAYYSESAQNLEIDGELLARALSKTDAALGHHLLTTLGIPAGALARGIGLRGAFVGRLDDDEAIRRIWDLWLCEGGLPTLIRTAVTLLVHGSRRQALLAARDADAALELMQSMLRGVKVEELLMKNSKVRCNDDDIKKERGRMGKVLAEAARKKGTMGGRGISLPKVG